MAPSPPIFDASELSEKVLYDVSSKRRKPPPTGENPSNKTGKIELSTCELLEMMQYHCWVEESGARKDKVLCRPVPRYYRRCQDKNGPFMVETTTWEARDGNGAVVSKVNGRFGDDAKDAAAKAAELTQAESSKSWTSWLSSKE